MTAKTKSPQRTRTLRIGAGASYAGDRIEPATELVANGKLDYIVYETLAERTVALAQIERLKDGASSADATAPGLRLYNLDAEIGERTNVAAQNPAVVQRLQALAQHMAADIGDGQPGPGVRPAGLVENPQLLYASIDTPKQKKAKKK